MRDSTNLGWRSTSWRSTARPSPPLHDCPCDGWLALALPCEPVRDVAASSWPDNTFPAMARPGCAAPPRLALARLLRACPRLPLLDQPCLTTCSADTTRPDGAWRFPPSRCSAAHSMGTNPVRDLPRLPIPSMAIPCPFTPWLPINDSIQVGVSSSLDGFDPEDLCVRASARSAKLTPRDKGHPASNWFHLDAREEGRTGMPLSVKERGAARAP